MATPAQVQTQLGDGNHNVPMIIIARESDVLKANYYVRGGTSYPGRLKWIECTKADTASAQATAILASLLAGPA